MMLRLGTTLPLTLLSECLLFSLHPLSFCLLLFGVHPLGILRGVVQQGAKLGKTRSWQLLHLRPSARCRNPAARDLGHGVLISANNDAPVGVDGNSSKTASEVSKHVLTAPSGVILRRITCAVAYRRRPP